MEEHDSKRKKKRLKKGTKKSKYCLSKSLRVKVQHLMSFTEMSHDNLWCTLNMTDSVTHFRKYKTWKYILFDSGYYYYRCYDVAIVILS